MKWLGIKRSLLALLCSGFLLQGACQIDENMFKTAFATASTGLIFEITKGSFKKWFDYGVRL